MKPLRWVGSSLKDLKAMPSDVRSEMGFALYLAQMGEKHPHAKVLKGFGSAAVLEVIEIDDGSTFRAVYTVQFRQAVYVLHCFKKKSRHGIATPRADMELVEHRLRIARLEVEEESQ